MTSLNRLFVARLMAHRRRHAALALLASALLGGCAHAPAPASRTAGRRPPPASLAPLPAQYAGRLPCGDDGCKHIALWLTIGPGRNYVLQQHYDMTAAQAAPDYVEVGQWKTEDSGQRLLLTPADSDQSATSFWEISDPDHIVALDQNAQPIQPVAAYTLSRRAASRNLSFADTRWYLVNAPDAASAGVAYIQFDDRQGLTGSTGCHALSGHYQRDGATLSINTLRASDGGACVGDEDTRQSMMEALRQTQSARVIGSYLLLFGAAGDRSPVAVFQAKTSAVPLSR